MIATIPSTERPDPRFDTSDMWSTAVLLDALWEGQAAALAAVHTALPELTVAVEAAVIRLRAGGRIAYAGAGTSGRLGALDAAELPPTFGVSAPLLLLAGGIDALTTAAEGAEDDADAARVAIDNHALGPADVVVAVAASGTTPFTCAAVVAARTRGCLTIAMANAADSPLLHQAEHKVLLSSGAEPIAGSTRMRAGTAQVVALKLFSTALMVALGHTYRGRMVDMRPTNAKLRARAARTLRDLAGCDEPTATRALALTAGNVKRAVLLVHGTEPDAVLPLLERHDNHLRRALDSLA